MNQPTIISQIIKTAYEAYSARMAVEGVTLSPLEKSDPHEQSLFETAVNVAIANPDASAEDLHAKEVAYDHRIRPVRGLPPVTRTEFGAMSDAERDRYVIIRHVVEEHRAELAAANGDPETESLTPPKEVLEAAGLPSEPPTVPTGTPAPIEEPPKENPEPKKAKGKKHPKRD